jgi:hypothetical protein
MDRQKARLLSDAVAEALKGVEEKFGVKLSPPRGRFGQNNMRVTLDFVEPTASGDFVDEEAKRLDAYAEMYGLPKDVRGKSFVDRGRKFTVVGLAQRRSRFPVLVNREDGRKFKYPVETVKELVKV